MLICDPVEMQSQEDEAQYTVDCLPPEGGYVNRDASHKALNAWAAAQACAPSSRISSTTGFHSRKFSVDNTGEQADCVK